MQGREGQALGGAGEGEPGLRECGGVGEWLWGGGEDTEDPRAAWPL